MVFEPFFTLMRRSGLIQDGCDLLIAIVAILATLRLSIAYVGGGYDDFLFVREASSVLDGHWLGPFDQLTLSKGCVYPLFLASAAGLHIPILAATEAVYLAGAWIFSRVAGAMTASRSGATICFLVLAANPVIFDGSSSIMLREPFYGGLTMLGLALVSRTLLFRDAGVSWGVASGLVLGAFWMTREEGIWLVPALAVLLAYRVWSDRGYRMAGTLVSITLPFASTLLTVASLNYHAYGVFRLNDFQMGPFPAAYGALSRIEHDHWQRMIPVPADARAKAYEVSGAARDLKSFLEGDVGRYWTRVSCENNPIAGCDDIQTGWFVWALRESAVDAGKYKTARDADTFYRALADEIDAACGAGKISCLPPRRGYLPPLKHIDFALVLRRMWSITLDFASLGPPNTGWAAASVADGPTLELYHRITPASTSTPRTGIPAGSSRSLGGKIIEWMAQTVSTASEIAFPVAFLWCTWRTFSDIGRRVLRPVTVLALATVAAIGTRVVLLAILDATSIPNVFRYEIPGLDLVLALIGLMVAQAWPAVAAWRQGRPAKKGASAYQT